MIGILALIISFVILWKLYVNRPKQWQYKSLPGPISFPIIGNMGSLFMAPRNERLELFRKSFQKWGPLVRLHAFSLDVIHTNSADIAQELLSSNTTVDKGYFYEFMKPWLRQGLLLAHSNDWHQRRRMLNPAFNYSVLINLVTETILHNSEILLKKFEDRLDSEGFNVLPYLSACTLDIICEAGMNVKMNTQRGSSKEYTENIQLITNMITNRMLNPLLHPNFIHRFTENYRNQQKGIKILHGISTKVIEERIQERKTRSEKKENQPTKENKKSLLDILLDFYDKDPGKFSIQDIRQEVDTFLFGGHDTTALAVSWALFLVGQNREIQQNIFEEVDAIFGTSDRLPDKNDLAQIKYLDCVFKEAMRLYPPIPVITRTMKENTQIGNLLIPAGADIAINICHIHRSPEHFHNPNKFDPSHFFPENIEKRHPYAYIPFSSGPRSCIGRKLSIIEQRILLTQIFRYFEVEAVQKMEDVTVVMDFVLRPENEIKIKLKRRKRQNIS